MNLKGHINDLVFPIIKLFLKNKIFIFRNKEYNYKIHSRSWNSERVVEIPIILEYIDKNRSNRNKRILEVGDVLFQYLKPYWDIVDKYPLRSGIIESDIINYKPIDKYDLIIMISTLEHIGFNEDVSGGEKPEDFVDNNKTEEAVNNMKNNCLIKNGILIITVPLGYNTEMDKKLMENKLGFTNLYYLKRITKDNKWIEINKEEVINPKYGDPFPCANYICIGVYENNNIN